MKKYSWKYILLKKYIAIRWGHLHLIIPGMYWCQVLFVNDRSPFGWCTTNDDSWNDWLIFIPIPNSIDQRYVLGLSVPPKRSSIASDPQLDSTCTSLSCAVLQPPLPLYLNFWAHFPSGFNFVSYWKSSYGVWWLTYRVGVGLLRLPTLQCMRSVHKQCWDLLVQLFPAPLQGC